MQLKIKDLKDFSALWQDDFLGQRGMLIPNSKKFQIGQKLDLEVIVDNEPWGSLKTVIVWHNMYGVVTRNTPTGIFLRMISSDELFGRKLNDAGYR